jgi:hypothetical protein
MSVDKTRGFIECYYCRSEATRFYRTDIQDAPNIGTNVIMATCEDHKVINTDYEELSAEDVEVFHVMVL